MLHVLIIPSWYPSHPGHIDGSFFREQALALHKNGCQVGVIYPQLNSLSDLRAILQVTKNTRWESDQGLEIRRSFGTRWFPRLPLGMRWLWIRHGLKLFREYIEKHGRPDIIHVHSMLYAGAAACEIKARYGIPFVVTEHSSAFARGLIGRSATKIAKQISVEASTRFAVSPALAAELGRSISDGIDGWKVMPNMVLQRFIDHPLPSTKSNTDFTFINIGSLNKNKRQINIIRAFASTFKDNAHVTLKIGGDGAEMPLLRKTILDLNASDKVILLGELSREQVLKEVAASNSLILASRYETFGVVLIEALALGKPVIATRCGGAEFIVRDKDGILVDVDDISSIEVAMRNMYGNYSMFDSQNIRNACRVRFSEFSIAKQLIDAYQDVVKVRSLATPT